MTLYLGHLTVLECLHERAAGTVCSSGLFPSSGSSLIVQGELLFVCSGLLRMNYSQPGLHIPHGHCLRLKLEVLSSFVHPPEYFDGACCKKNSVGGDHLLPRMAAD